MTAKEAAPSKEAIEIESMEDSTEEVAEAAIPGMDDDEELDTPPEGVKPEDAAESE